MTNWNINHYFPEFAKLDRYMIGSDKMAETIGKAFQAMSNNAPFVEALKREYGLIFSSTKLITRAPNWRAGLHSLGSACG